MSLSSLMAAKWYPILFDSPMNIARNTAFWLTIALALGFALCALLLKGDTRKKFFKISLVAAVVYASAVGLTLLVLTYLEDGIQLILFAPILVLLLCIAGSAIAIYFKPKKLTFAIAGGITGAAAVAALVCMGVYLASGEAENFNGLEISVTENALLYVCAAALVGVLLFFALFFGRNDKKGFSTKSISYAAVCIALSFALSYLRFVKLPQGGSITVASLLPLMIYSYMFGVKKGIFAGFIYGILQAVQDPYIIHPAQFLLDYPVAFACIGVSGLFAKVQKLNKFPQIQFALGAVIASVLRYLSHVLSGVFAFSEYAYHWTSGEAMNPWLYSLGYNSFVFADIAIAIGVGILVFCSKAFVKQVRKFNVSAPVPAQPAPIDEAAPADAEKTQSEASENSDDKTE